MSRRHACGAMHCDTPIPLELLMCSRHWFMVPRGLQREIMYHYRACMRGSFFVPSRDYDTAVARAKKAVLELEGLARKEGAIFGLTVSQPWVTSILQGPQRVLNQRWSLQLPPGGLWLALHAGQAIDAAGLSLVDRLWPDCPPVERLPRGRVLGVIHLRAWLNLAEAAGVQAAFAGMPAGLAGDPWASGPFCGVIDQVAPLQEPLPCADRLGIWELPAHIFEAAQAARETVLHAA